MGNRNEILIHTDVHKRNIFWTIFMSKNYLFKNLIVMSLKNTQDSFVFFLYKSKIAIKALVFYRNQWDCNFFGKGNLFYVLILNNCLFLYFAPIYVYFFYVGHFI